MCYDLKRLKFGLFVIFHDQIPITNGEKVVGYGLGGLKIRKKVICRDLKPIADSLEVICYDFEPIMDRVEVMNHHLEAVANRSERMVKTLVMLSKALLSRLGIFDASPPSAGLCRAETNYSETACAVSKLLNLLTIKLFCNE